MSKKNRIILIAVVAAVVAVGTALILLLRNDMPGHRNVADIEWYDEKGTEFIIEDRDMLYDVATLSYYYTFEGQILKLGADITVNEGNAAEWETKAPRWFWNPIRNFAGTFDGQGHTISGLYAKMTNEPTALFRDVDSKAVIRDFRLENSAFFVAGSLGAASIAANCAGTYQRIYSDAIVHNSYGTAGGLISRQAGKITVTECWFDGEVQSGFRRIGGIADQADNAEMVIAHCLNTGKLICTRSLGADDAGGLVGMTVNSGRIVIEDSFSAGTLELANLNRSGSVLGGGDSTSSATIINCFSMMETFFTPISDSISNKVGGAAPVPEKDLKGIKAYQWTNLDFENYWACQEDALPTLQCFAEKPLDTAGVIKEVDYDWYSEDATELVITNLPQLYAFTMLSYSTDYVGKTVKLGTDLTLNDGLAENWIENAPENRWYPVQSFGGAFDGQGHTLSGIYVKGMNTLGFFSRAKGTALIQNFYLKNSLIHATGDGLTNTGYTFSGAIVGRGGGTFDHIYTDALIYSEGAEAGGLIGQVNLSGMITTVNNCWFDGKVITVGEEFGFLAGGIAGAQALGTLNITHCLVTGTIHTEVNKGSKAGGFVGATMNAVILNVGDSLFTGMLDTANPNYVGGAVGVRQATSSITYNDTYAVRESMENPTGSYVSQNESTTNGEIIGGAIPVLARHLDGTEAYAWTSLDFDEYWSLRPDGTPVLTAFYTGDKVSTSGLSKVYSFDWYDAEAGGGTIYSRRDFIGFTMLSWTTDFKGKTVRLGADITVNSGDASTWGSSEPYWRMIPMSTFSGTFDGQGHTISGVFQREKAVLGLFSKTSKTATVRNFRLVNSFFDVLGYRDKSNILGLSGSIVGRGGGKLDTIYSNAIIRARGIENGGMIGQVNVDASNRFQNLWFDGSIRGIGEEYGYYAGGIAGGVLKGTNTFAHCLFTGVIETDVTGRGSKVGGIVASVENQTTATINDCLSAGTLKCGNPYYKGAIMGTMYTKCKVTITNCYADSKVALGKNGQFVSAAKQAQVLDEELQGSAIPISTENLTGLNGYRWTTLDFANYWAPREGACPGLKSFVREPLSTASTQKMIDVSWYKASAKTLIVDSVADLYGLSIKCYTDDFAGKTVKLGANIVLNSGDASAWGESAPANSWTGISSFAGTLDGQGHTVSGVYMDGGASSATAFISVLQGGTVKNLRLVNSYVTSTSSDLASLVGQSYGGTVENVYSNAIVTSPKGGSMAGLICSARGDKTTTVRNCQFDGQVLCMLEGSGGSVGGLTCMVVNTATVLRVENCLMSGKVYSGAALSMGGVACGASQDGATAYVSDTLVSGTVTSGGGGRTGSVVGNAKWLKLNTTNVYAASDSGVKVIGYGTAASGTAQAIKRAALLGGQGYQNTQLDFTAKPYWAAVDGATPVLAAFYNGTAVDVSKLLRPDVSWYSDSEDTFIITNAAQLLGVAALSADHNFAGKTVKLGADIDLNPDWTASAEAPAQIWQMVGNSKYPFQGTFDGQGHTVRGVYVNNDSTMGTGFFAWVNGGGTVKDFALANSYLIASFSDDSGISRVGAVAGDTHTTGAVISGVTVSSDVTVQVAGSQAGGMVGCALGDLTLTDCSMEGTVLAQSKSVGGLLGAATNSGAIQISGCTVTGTVTGTQSVGGVMGYISRAGEVVLTDCTVSTVITGTQNVGGAIGEQAGAANVAVTVKDCASSAVISASGTPSRCGGVMGYATKGTLTVSGCTFDGTIDQAGQMAGGILAQVTGATVSIEECVSTGAITSGARAGTILGYVGSGEVAIIDSIGVNGTSASKVCGDKGSAASLTLDNAVSLPLGSNDATEQTYVISTKEQLERIALLSDKSGFGGITLQLDADIDLNPGWTAGADAPEDPWHVMNTGVNFRGTLDGQGHAISGVYAVREKDQSGYSRAGLIAGISGGTVCNLKITNAYIAGNGYELGAVAGVSFGGTVEKVYTDAIISSSNGINQGGLIGAVRNEAVTVLRNCQFDGQVICTDGTGANGQIGGLIGTAVNGTSVAQVEHCLMSGSVTAVGAAKVTGGVVASASSSGAKVTVSDTLVTGTVTGGGYSGAFIGSAKNMTGQIVNSYAAAESCAADTDGIGLTGANMTNSGTVLASADMKGANCFKNTKLNVTSYWGAVADGMPVLLAFYTGETLPAPEAVSPVTDWYDAGEDTFILTTASQFLGFAQLSQSVSFAGKTVKLGADIDLNPYWTAGEIEPEIVWPMVGRKNTPFQGIFDGQSHAVRGVYVSNHSTMGTGLFAWVNGGGTVKDFTLSNSYIASTYSDSSGISRVGAIAGNTHTTGATISGVTVSSDVTVRSTGGQVGGIVGGSLGALTLTDCRMAGAVIAQKMSVGGLLGACANSGTAVISDNVMTGTVTAAASQAGGVVGWVARSGVTISGNTVSGEVTGTTLTGGIAGTITAANCTISGCTVTGTVTGTASDGNTSGSIGGVAGQVKSTGCTITGCTVTGTVYSAGAYELGGVVGTFAANGTVEKTYCAATVVMAQKARNVGGILGAVRQANVTVTVSQTQFDGTVTTHESQTDEKGQIAGFVGSVVLSSNKLYVTDCLMSGTVSTDKTGMSVAGIVALAGQTGAKCELTRTLITGSVVSGGGNTGAVAGDGELIKVTMSDVYALSDPGTNGLGRGSATGTLTVLTAEQLQGESAKISASALDYETVWITVDSAAPALRCLTK
ncbi:MAG: hypothetical protein IJT78_01145 [Oscillospiraceae bacterium]|nr:hypothetical protein [Oscillospiraceae bacterium]